MSDLSLRLLQATSQLPISSYFDAGLYQREQQKLFAKGPRYLGHELAVPHLGDYYALPHEGEGRALVRNSGGIELISNVCRHRQSTMLQGRGSLGSPARQQHRLPAAPLDVQHLGRADRRAALRDRSVPEPQPLQDHDLERAGV